MLKAIRNMDYTVLLCSEVEPMKRFYGEVLGFPLVNDFGTWVEFQVGATLLTLRKRGTGYDGVREADGSFDGTGAACQLAFRVPPAAVATCYTELQEKGVSILSAPMDRAHTKHRTLFFKDPENNVLEIYAEI
jgi:glyoxylase I family protein